MDWEAEYNSSKAGRTDSVSGPSRRNNEDHDDPMFNDIGGGGGDPGRNDGRRGADRDAQIERRTRERVELLPEEEPKGTPLEQLTRHWMNERHAPDILPAQETLLAHLLDHLRRQVGLFTSILISSDLNVEFLCVVVLFLIMI
jgi:GINS complex subunit 4